MILVVERANADGPRKWQKRLSGEHDVLHFGDCVDAVLDSLCMLMTRAIEHALEAGTLRGPHETVRATLW
jgi:hypothetical protein